MAGAPGGEEAGTGGEGSFSPDVLVGMLPLTCLLPVHAPRRTINRPQGPPEHSQVLPAGHLSAELICPSLTESVVPAAGGQGYPLAGPGGWHLPKQTLSFGCCWESQGIRIGKAGVGDGVKSKPPMPETCYRIVAESVWGCSLAWRVIFVVLFYYLKLQN